MLHGLQTLADDPQTDVIVLISKPPAQAIADKILAQAAPAIAKPVVVNFLEQGSPDVNPEGAFFTDSLAHSAEVVVALYRKQPVPRARQSSEAGERRAVSLGNGLNSQQARPLRVVK
jgi:succinyl-CoA synthetase alpha subunit